MTLNSKDIRIIGSSTGHQFRTALIHQPTGIRVDSRGHGNITVDLRQAMQAELTRQVEAVQTR